MNGRKPIEHGTDRGYRAHLRRDQYACDECLAAHREAERERSGRSPAPRELMPCGTPAAYRRHLRNEGVACDRCKAAHAEAVAAYSRGSAA